MSKQFFSFLLATIFLFSSIIPVQAQQSDNYPVYVVQSGDTLSLIALKFDTTVDEILKVNNITNANALNVGMELNIPGYPGLTGVLQIKTLNLGDSLYSISRKYQQSDQSLAQLNKITSPASLYAGSELIVPVQKDQKDNTSLINFPDKSMVEISSLMSTNNWAFTLNNNIQNSWDILPGDRLAPPGNAQNLAALSNPISEIIVNPLPLVQGSTIVFHIKTTHPLTITGNLSGHTISFFSDSENNYYGLEGIHALDEVGLKTMEIKATGPNNENINIQQSILLVEGSFIQEAVNGVDPNSIDPNVIKQEDDILNAITTTSATRLWTGAFKYPVDDPCEGSTFGNRRTYNEGTYHYYHTGVDFSVCQANNLNIYAPAPGVVLFTGLLPTKGNYTVIDHGWGVYSCYAHQSEFKVKVGDHVDTGQTIGVIGNTGRTLGPHLHWEIWVNHIPIDPIAWTKRNFPD
jgi:murein DD-endopeptidase MepM/ murein hydrolase activator NlpD